MKLSGIFSLFLLTVPSAMALRGAANRSLEDAVTVERVLGTGENYDGFTKKRGACRIKSNGSGAGDSGDFTRYKKKDDGSPVTHDWCYKKCDRSSSCTGFEFKFSTSNGGKHCEIWKTDFKGVETRLKDSYDCYFKEDDDDDGPPEYKNYIKWDGACRTFPDGTGAGKDGKEFQRFTKSDISNLSFDWCRNLCDTVNDKGNVDCYGFEYVDAGDKSHCEMWKTRMRSANDKIKNAYCYVNKKFPMPRGGD